MERGISGKDIDFVGKSKDLVNRVLDSNIADTVVVGTLSAIAIVKEHIASLIPKSKKSQVL